MQENNFEKEVKQVMQELSITPSDNLWSQVKAGLDEKRKKRRWWFAAMISCACLLLPSLLLNDLEKRNGKNVTTQIATENKIDKATVAPETETLKRETIPTEKKKIDQSSSIQETVTIEQEKLPTSKKGIVIVEKKQGNNQQKINNKIAEQLHPIENKDVKKAKQFFADKRAALVVSAGETGREEEQDVTADPAQVHYPVKVDAANIELISVKADREELTTAIEPITLTISKPIYKITAGIREANHGNKNKGRFEITASAGRFSLSENSLLGAVFNSNQNKSFDMQSSNLNGGVGMADTVLYSQSYLKNGNAFSVALNYLKPVSKKMFISFGVGFRYGNTHLVSSSYLAYLTPSNNFDRQSLNEVNTSNRFYFIDFPIQLQSLVGKGKRLPIYWNAGFTYSYLINSSATQFNAIQNNYSNMGSSFTKNIFGITAGLDIELLKNKKSAFKIGPSLYYSFSKASEANLYKNLHYHFTGIRVKKIL